MHQSTSIPVEYAKLPTAPQNASPVPHLTSLYHFDDSKTHGDRRYPGNCGGGIIHALLTYFQPASVFDPMTGSETCLAVSRALGIRCFSTDIRDGFDATDLESFRRLPANVKFDFIWLHPPYWRQKLYTPDPRDLSRAPTLEAFLERYRALLRNCAQILAPQGKLAVLMGDYNDRKAGFIPLTYETKRLAYSVGLRSHCTDIIRFLHETSSSRKVYQTKFIPGLHDVCMIFEHAR
jgi:SAM-dependent methyltransferase